MNFRGMYSPDSGQTIPSDTRWNAPPRFASGANGLEAFIQEYGGLSFNGGVYRVHSGTDIARWTSAVEEAFPDSAGRILCFSTDWLGRQFALDCVRREGTQFMILMFEPGTGQALQVPSTFEAFHDVELVDYADSALAVGFYKSWATSGGSVPGLSECIGYKVPLFLGGKDVIENLEVSDMDVYWSVCGQLLNRTRNLKDGERIGRVDIE